VDVAVDLAVGTQGGREGDGRGVRAAAAQGRDLALVADALESSDDDDLAGGELVLDAKGADLDDACAPVSVRGDDARLRAGQADRGMAEALNRHRQDRHGLPL